MSADMLSMSNTVDNKFSGLALADSKLDDNDRMPLDAIVSKLVKEGRQTESINELAKLKAPGLVQKYAVGKPSVFRSMQASQSKLVPLGGASPAKDDGLVAGDVPFRPPPGLPEPASLSQEGVGAVEDRSEPSDENTAAEPAKWVCESFLRRKCKRGDRCKFSHDLNAPRENKFIEQDAIAAETARAQQVKFMTAHMRFCENQARLGYCLGGKLCPFMHTVPPPPQPYVDPACLLAPVTEVVDVAMMVPPPPAPVSERPPTGTANRALQNKPLERVVRVDAAPAKSKNKIPASFAGADAAVVGNDRPEKTLSLKPSAVSTKRPQFDVLETILE